MVSHITRGRQSIQGRQRPSRDSGAFSLLLLSQGTPVLSAWVPSHQKGNMESTQLYSHRWDLEVEHVTSVHTQLVQTVFIASTNCKGFGNLASRLWTLEERCLLNQLLVRIALLEWKQYVKLERKDQNIRNFVFQVLAQHRHKINTCLTDAWRSQ